MDDLITFLNARLGEDEDEAASPAGPPSLRARQRREVEAKRAIVQRYERGAAGELPDWKAGRELIEAGLAILLGVLRDLATVYSDHPDYRPEWKP